MTKLTAETIEVAGVGTRVLRGGNSDAPAALFLHGGVPGITPYCSGAHIWGAVLNRFADIRRVVVPDLPGSGATPVPPGGALTFDALVGHVADLIEALGLRDVHIVGHD